MRFGSLLVLVVLSGCGGSSGDTGKMVVTGAGGESGAAGASGASGGDDACPMTTPTCSPSGPRYASVASIFRAHCMVCHSTGKIESKRPLDSYAHVVALRQDALSQIYNCEMPPAGEPPLDAQTRETLLDWLACTTPAE
jgi:hypothetical protein